MTPQRKQRLIIIAIAVTFGWPLVNIVGALLFGSTSNSGLYLMLGGRVEADDDLLPATDPAFTASLHSRYHIYANQIRAGGNEIALTLGASPPIPATPAMLRGVACRVGGWLARQPGWPQHSALTIALDRSQDPGPIEVKAADCPAAP
jgi:hypothetical protein